MLLLDTCGLTAFARGDPALDAINDTLNAAGLNGLLVSPITAWEIADLSVGKPKPDTLVFRGDPAGWWRRTLNHPRIQLITFTPAVAFAAYTLPESFHRDPADRLLVATARVLGCPIVTSDAKIIAYGRLGHVQVIPF